MKILSVGILLLCVGILKVQAQTIVDPKIPAFLASERDSLPVEGELLYDCANLGAYSFFSSGGATNRFVDADTVLVFGKKFMMDIKKAGTNPWEPQLQTPTNIIPVNTGDVLLYVFFIRTTETESPNDFGKAEFYIQKATDPWTGIGSLSLSLSTSWRKVYVVAEATADYGVSEMSGTFHLGFMQQKVEIGGMLALNLGSVDISLLPTNDPVYDGMDPEAAWRAEAEVRIEQFRKSDISVKVLDREGNPAGGSVVSIQMKDHAFGFGNFISDLVLQETTDGNNYQSHVTDMFNVATTPFYMGESDSWGWYSGPEEQENYQNMAQWLQSKEMPAKGHVLIWPGWDWMPSFFKDLSGDPAELRQAINDHLEILVPIGKENGLYEWDVVNEPYVNHDVMDILGEEVLVDWYNRVHELDPIPRLILNEYNILMGGGMPGYQDNFERVINYLKSENAPLGGIGMQCHFDENMAGIPRVLEVLDRFAELDLPIQITEFDVAIRNEDIQAEYLRDFYTAVFSHPATDKIVMWGFYEKVMWKPLGALVRTDWTYKPIYHTYMDLVYNRWWTPDTTGVSDDEGTFGLRGYNGYYDVSFGIGDSTFVLNDLRIEQDTLLEVSPQLLEAGIPVPEVKSADPYLLISYPNPFKDKVTLSCYLERPAELSFHIYSIHGQLVRSVPAGHCYPGNHQISFDLSVVPSGVYMGVVQSDNPSYHLTPLRIVKE